ncbi:2-amino-4-hydroxy-6-hydroxymethyldihydropteridine diphosphokinase [Bartonella sp. DGB2]|uniref:2-amino-4-hydroxy-6- hydroxymethyldihydropteridine diphosphokinase n=1 Tax=Bartonella sp. DGB2 TaxID=3388426 RepID=UPI0039901585
MKTFWLSFGSNIGDSVGMIAQTLEHLRMNEAIVLGAVSSFYITPPWGKLDQPPFINACCELTTVLSPEALLALCLDLEKQAGRVRKEKWGPRCLDIDLLVCDFINSYQSPMLTLPHPHMLERPFVLQPLAEIAGDLLVKGKTISDWAAEKFDSEVKPVTL